MNEAASTPERPAQSADGSDIAQASGKGSTAIVNKTINQFQTAALQPIAPAEIAAAEALLAELPLDSLPEPSGLPPGSVMPWRRNRFFVGRGPDLCQIARTIKHGGTAAVGQSPAVTGMGGQGRGTAGTGRTTSRLSRPPSASLQCQPLSDAGS